MKGNMHVIAILLGFSGVIGSIATYKVTTIMFSKSHGIKPITYHFDDRLSKKSQKKIVAYIEQHRYAHSQALVSSVCSTFDYIKSAQLHYTPHTVNIHIQAHNLSAIINNQYAVTTSLEYSTLLNIHDFNPQIINELKQLNLDTIEHVSAQSILPSTIHEWIIRMPHDLFTQFHVSWIDENNIECTYKKDPQLTIRCTHTQNIDATDIESCLYAKNTLPSHMLSIHKKIVADVRFDQQIIISKA